MKRFDNKLLLHNIKLNGWKALAYAYGLGDTRYVEYSAVLDSLGELTETDMILDIGCGHSMLPSMLQSKLKVVAIDINANALKWQMEKSKRFSSAKLYLIRASATHLPFKQEIFWRVISISAIEHLPDQLDKKASAEASRVLRYGGVAVITLPGHVEGDKIRTNPFEGVPVIYQKLMKPVLPFIFRKFNVDRGNNYYERRYSLSDARERISKEFGNGSCEFIGIVSRARKIGELVILGSHKYLLPFSVVALIEFIFAKNYETIKLKGNEKLWKFCHLLILRLTKVR